MSYVSAAPDVAARCPCHGCSPRMLVLPAPAMVTQRMPIRNSLSLSLNTHKQRSLSLITNKHLLSLSARHRYSESLTPGMVTERMALVKIHTLPDAGHGSSVSRKLGVTDRPRDTLLVAWQGVYSDTPSRTLADTSAAAFVVRRGTRVFYPVIGAQTSSTLSYSVGLWAKWGGALPLRLCGCAALGLLGCHQCHGQMMYTRDSSWCLRTQVRLALGRSTCTCASVKHCDTA